MLDNIPNNKVIIEASSVGLLSVMVSVRRACELPESTVTTQPIGGDEIIVLTADRLKCNNTSFVKE